MYMFDYLYTCMAALIIVFSNLKGKTPRNKVETSLPGLPSMYPHVCAIAGLSRLGLNRCSCQKLIRSPRKSPRSSGWNENRILTRPPKGQTRHESSTKALYTPYHHESLIIY